MFMCTMDRLSANQFQGVHTNNFPIGEDLLLLNIHPSGNDIVEGNNIGELSWRSVKKHENTVRFLRYKNVIRYVSNNNAVFESFRCPNCHIFFNTNSNLQQHLIICSERVKISIRGTNIKSDKLCSTGWILLVLSTRVNKNSSKV